MVQNKNSNKPKIFEWAYCLNKEQRQKKYEELCKTYNIKENELQSAEHNVPELKTNCEFEHFLTQNKMRIWVIY